MARLGSIILCAAWGAALLACGSNTSGGNGSGGNGGGGNGGGGNGGTLGAVPLNNDVSGWTVDKNIAKTAASVPALTATTEDGAVGMIDGAAAPFFKSPFTPTLFAWQNYVNASLPSAPPNPMSPVGAAVTLYIWEMPTVDQASGLYSALLRESEYNQLAGTSEDWQDPVKPALGDDSRIEDTHSGWWINFRKGVRYVEVQLTPSFGPPPDYTPSNVDNKNEAIRFAQWVAGKL